MKKPNKTKARKSPPSVRKKPVWVGGIREAIDEIWERLPPGPYPVQMTDEFLKFVIQTSGSRRSNGFVNVAKVMEWLRETLGIYWK